MQIGSQRADVTGSGTGAVPSAPSSNDFEDFIYLISHDVRSSVRALIELPQWIVEDLEQQGVRIEGSVASSLELLNRHTGRLDRMLVDLLTYSRIGRMQETKSIDLEKALDEVCEEMEIPQSFKLLRQLDCRSLTIGERDILTLLSALIQNAMKHHDRGQGQIIVTTEQEGDEVVLRVSDDGPGIEEVFAEKVFGAMTTLRPRDEVEGSGMGLAQVRKIAEYYGGSAQVAPSPYGRGTQVTVRIAAPWRPTR